MPTAHPPSDARPDLSVNPVFTRQPMHIPRFRLPDGELPPDTAYQLVHDELMLDGNARLNLATFVTTWMPPLAAKLMGDTADKNMIDKDEYPQTAEIEKRCVNILGDLWHAPGAEDATGTSTTGSSEAAMLGGLALLWRWRARRRDAGRPTATPNLVMGINVQVCWDKFCRYWDVEPRLVPMEGERFHLDAEQAAKYCDENTIGVVAILGSTFDGSYEPVAEIAAALDALAAGGGPDVPLHVDAASGGFVAPFIQPDLVWDFQLPRVQSINASGHKYGLVYPGVGWALWRDAAALPDELVFKVNYLGGEMPTFALNFSRGGAQVVAQYYSLIRLGREGFRSVQQDSRDTARYLSGEIAAALDRLAADGGPDVPLHVDAASGGFIAPFLDPELVWDFRLPRVASINSSGHKYGLVYPGVGWALWRDADALPEELIFHVDYLGGDMPTFALNFSRPGAQVVTQYYTLLRLGWEGFRRVQQSCRDNARRLAAEIAEIGPFELISDGGGIPVFAFRLRAGVDDYTVFDVSETLRIKGWLVPAYRMPPALQDVAVLRIVVRNDFSHDLGSMLLDDLRWAVKRLAPGAGGGDRPQRRGGFHH